MEFTGELPDSDVESVVEDWADSNLEARIEDWMQNHNDHDDAWNDRIERLIRGLLESFTPGGGHCHTARSFEQAVNSIMDHRGEIVIKQNVDGITGEVRDALAEMAVNEILDHRGELVLKPHNDALAEMVAKEVEAQVSVMVVNIQRGLRRLHVRAGVTDVGAGGPEVAGSI